VLLGDARSIITNVDLLKARAKGMSAGLEPELSVVIDVFYPIDAVTQVATRVSDRSIRALRFGSTSKRSEAPSNPCSRDSAASAWWGRSPSFRTR